MNTKTAETPKEKHERQKQDQRKRRLERLRREVEEETSTDITEHDIAPKVPYVGGPEAVRKFDEAHGQCGIAVQGQIIYPDGAARDTHPMGILMEPPEDAFKRYSVQVEYWETLVDEAVEEFDSIKQEVELMAKHSAGRHAPLGTEEIKAKLLRWKKIVEARRKRLRRAKRKLSKTPQYELQRERETEIARNQGKWNEFVGEVREIDI